MGARWGMIATALFMVVLLGSLFLSLTIVGCSMPKWQVFQKKIEAKDGQKPQIMVEAERRAAKFLAFKSRVVEANPAKQIAEINAVAEPLSESLGEPKEVVTVTEDKDAVIADLRAGVLSQQKQADKWKEFALKYAGKPIEDTGINLAGPAGLLGLVLLIAACIAFPPIGWAILRALPLLWGCFRRMTAAVNELATSNPDAADQLKAKLSVQMDKAHKKLVARWAAKPT